LVTVADADSDALGYARAIAPGTDVVRDYHEVARRTDLDAVVIALPNHLHASAAIAFLASGTSVYVEKPLAVTTMEAERVREAATGAICAVGFNYRFNRLYEAARRLIEEGRIGPVRSARSVFRVDSGPVPQWKRARETGGGALLDLGSHHVDLAVFLLGKRVESVRADIRSLESEDDCVDLELHLEDGCDVRSSFHLQGAPAERFEIEGDLGSLIVDRTRYQDVVFRPRGKTAPEPTWLRGWQALTHGRYVLEKRRTPGHEPSHRIALERFFDAVRSERRFRPDVEDGVACLRILEAAERSSRSGRPEPVGGTG
jgi:predicted dehydrogenase